jgi:hypothetical protein
MIIFSASSHSPLIAILANIDHRADAEFIFRDIEQLVDHEGQLYVSWANIEACNRWRELFNPAVHHRLHDEDLNEVLFQKGIPHPAQFETAA